MKGLLILLAAVFAVPTSLSAQTHAPAPGTAQGQGLAIGFVDVERCLKEYKKAEEQRKSMKSEIEDKIRALSEEKRKVEAAKDNKDLYTQGSQEWLDLMKKIRMQETQIELDGQALQFQYQQKFAELIGKLYEEVRKEIKNVAEAKGLKLVLMYVSTLPKGQNETDVTNNIMVRPVVYFDPGSDITAEVVSRLNK
jgi:Skp family chaperone for outer membrane proteins